MRNTISEAAAFKEGGLHAAQHTRTLLWFYTAYIIVGVRFGKHAYAVATAPCGVAYHFSQVMLQVYNLIAQGLRW